MHEPHDQDSSARPKMYVLAEFPYPSAAGLHIGHAFTFTGSDVYARYQRMIGKNVLFPIGWDAFGLPTENYALTTGRKPQEVTRESTQAFERQMKALGFSFDWDRMVNTTDPKYYKWTQWIFIRLFEKGLATRQEMPINWCPKDKVGLANEEVINGRCERCGTPVVRRMISQWVVRITAYADRLIDGLEQTEFIDKVKAAQVNWIGRSEGANIQFQVENSTEVVRVFTTRPDTLWGCTFLVVAPEHALVAGAMNYPGVMDYIEASRRRSDLERSELSGAKTGVFSGLSVQHPATGESLPVWISDFVLPSYGTGAIMAVPAHDQRDYDFARQMRLPVKPVIEPEAGWDFGLSAYTGLDGVLIHSGPIDGLSVRQAIPAAIEWLEENSQGEGAVSYHLRDWIFSRQHYWGEPIPMIHCLKCGWVPVPDEDLPVVLPEVERYQPTDTGESPLANLTEWVNVNCSRCGGPARRETDTMPNWAGSDWYYLRYTDPHNDERLADMQKLKYWMPVDVYVGGDEHNTLHLLYSRFIYQFLYDLGVVPQEIPEPYKKRLSHGVILGPDGTRMSKSRGNVVVPDVLVKRYGADTVRMYLMFIGPYDATMAWNERALHGMRRFVDRFERWVMDNAGNRGGSSPLVKRVTNRLGKNVGDDIAAFKFNTALAKIMEALNTVSNAGEQIAPAHLEAWLRILAPFAPFLAERGWQKLGKAGSVHDTAWPAYDPKLDSEQKVEVPVMVNGKLRATVWIDLDEEEAAVQEKARSLEGVAKYLDAGKVEKIVYVPGKAINFVIRG